MTLRALAFAGVAILFATFHPLHAEQSIRKATAVTPTPPATVDITAAEPISAAEPLREEPIMVTSVLVSEPYIAMTFDDGPHGTLTPKLLKMLAERNIRATFFVVGECAAERPEVLAQTAAAGHEIGNHSWSHPNLAKRSQDSVREELRKTDDVITQVTGKRPVVFRPPYGSFTKAQQEWAHEEFGYVIVLWDVDPLDWKKPGSSVVADRIVSRTGKGSIVLAHDIHSGTVAAMPSTLDRLLAKGFKFVTVSELLKLREEPKPEPTPAVAPIETVENAHKDAVVQ